MDGTDFRFIILLEEIRNELKMIRRTLDMAVLKDAVREAKKQHPAEPKTSDP